MEEKNLLVRSDRFDSCVKEIHGDSNINNTNSKDESNKQSRIDVKLALRSGEAEVRYVEHVDGLCCVLWKMSSMFWILVSVRVVDSSYDQ